MPIVVKCDCGRSLHAKEDFAGRKARCPACGAILTVPQPGAERNVEDEALGIFLSGSATEEAANPPVAPYIPAQSEAVASRPAAPAAPVPRKPTPRPAPEDGEPTGGPRVAFEEGWFGSMNAGAIGGILMMVIAVVWFVVGLMGGIIFFYPPILLVIGFIAFIKGLFGGE